jgi:hypothetical protein
MRTQDAEPPEALSRDQEAQDALHALGASTLREAQLRADGELQRARACACCSRLLAHLHERVGSTLYLDDDPGDLARAFDPHDCDAFARRVLAACIVLFGRERVAAPV